jgi:hypothetical protein
VSKPTISFSGMTFDVDDIHNHSIQMPGLNVVEFDINKIKHAEMSVEFKWQQHHAFQAGTLVTLNGVLCRVVSVDDDGTIMFEKAKETK